MKAGDFETLKSLMDAQCVVFPPDGEPEAGQAYLERVHSSAVGSPAPDLVELVQDWEEARVLGDFACEQGIVRAAWKSQACDSIVILCGPRRSWRPLR